jgi:ABC-type phosphate transport system auxiliary subunit
MAAKNDDWTEWRQHILIELERLNKKYEEVNQNLNALQTSVTILKVKAGGISALIASGMSLVVSVILTLIGGK